MSEFTACTKCKHFLNTMKNPAVRDVWYNHRCRASKKELARDPYDGEMKPASVNDLRGRYFDTEEFGEYHYCRDINTNGNCPRYERKWLSLVV